MTRSRRYARFEVVGAAMAWTVTVLPAQESAPPEGLVSMIDDCSRMSPAAAGRHVKEKTANLGHLEISVTDGTATPVVGKSGRLVGFYLDGSGGYRYQVTGSEDRASFAANLARVAKSLRSASNGVTDRFSKMLVLFSNPVLSDIWDEASGEQSSGTPVGASGFTDLLSGALSSYPEFDFRSAVARLNGKGRFVYVEFDGGLERVATCTTRSTMDASVSSTFARSRTTPID